MTTTAPPLNDIQAYYDERIEGKIWDFTHCNPRIEAAIATLAEWAPSDPKRVLEIGCSIGATAWRMARAWPRAEVIGADLSAASIDVARTCFALPNLTFSNDVLTERSFSRSFDLIVMMDVYEHIALEERSSIHAVIRSLLSSEARVFLSFPTPALQHYGQSHQTAGLQPIDEDIYPKDILRLTEETDTQMLYYREVGIWHYGDYAHLVLGRFDVLTDVALRQPKPKGLQAIKPFVKNLLRKGQTAIEARYDYLGSDLLRLSSREMSRQFQVTARERRRLASAWRR
jgi:SAM-dependent methyltransferase